MADDSQTTWLLAVGRGAEQPLGELEKVLNLEHSVDGCHVNLGADVTKSLVLPYVLPLPCSTITLHAESQYRNLEQTLTTWGSDVKQVIVCLQQPPEEAGFQELIETAERNNVRVLIEPRGSVRVAQALEWLDRWVSVHLSLDIRTLAANEYDTGHAIEACSHYLAHLRLSDSNGWAPGLGAIPWRRVSEAIKQCQGIRQFTFDMVWRPNLPFALQTALSTTRHWSIGNQVPGTSVIHK